MSGKDGKAAWSMLCSNRIASSCTIWSCDIISATVKVGAGPPAVPFLPPPGFAPLPFPEPPDRVVWTGAPRDGAAREGRACSRSWARTGPGR